MFRFLSDVVALIALAVVLGPLFWGYILISVFSLPKNVERGYVDAFHQIVFFPFYLK